MTERTLSEHIRALERDWMAQHRIDLRGCALVRHDPHAQPGPVTVLVWPDGTRIVVVGR